MKQLQPFHVLIYLAGILVLLTGISFLVKGDKIDLFGLDVRFLTFNEALTPPKAVEKKDITNIVQVDTMNIERASADTTIKNTFESDGKMGAPAGGTLSAEAATTIQYNEKGQQALHLFFEKLEAAANGKKVRILHYGDSQIEGDRMTSYIRQRLQSQFGGFGPGTIPAKNEYNTITFKQTCSPNFTRYTAFGGASLKSRKYGSMNTAARFTPEMDSSQMAASTSIKEAFIEIEPTKTAYSRARSYNHAKMFYTPNKLRYEFSASVSPTIIGFSLESDYGVFVDNIGMRGSSGTFFGKIDHNLASKMYADLNVEMVIMQFGGNGVPYMSDSSSVRRYAKQFKGQLYTIKKLRPSASILVIGPSDMSMQSVAGRVTYKMLPFLVQEMTKVSKEVGACYWDLFSAMGGENSMPSWVEKGLAGNDYIHFTNRGASIASQLFFDALAAEYVKWKQRAQ